MKLADIYKRTEWLHYEISLEGFINLFPVEIRKGKPVRPDRPGEIDLDRDTFLAVMVAFKQAYS